MLLRVEAPLGCPHNAASCRAHLFPVALLEASSRKTCTFPSQVAGYKAWRWHVQHSQQPLGYTYPCTFCTGVVITSTLGGAIRRASANRREQLKDHLFSCISSGKRCVPPQRCRVAHMCMQQEQQEAYTARDGGSPEVVRVYRNSPPFLTQLRHSPTDSRDPNTFLPDSVADDELVQLLEVDESNLFALVQPMQTQTLGTRNRGWIQVKYLKMEGYSDITGFGSISVDSKLPCEVQQVTIEDLTEEAFDCEPLVVIGAAPSLHRQGKPAPGRLPRLLGLAEELELRCKVLCGDWPLGASREEPHFVCWKLPKPETPMVLGVYRVRSGCHGTAKHWTYRLCSNRLLQALDVLGYLALPLQCPDILDDAVPVYMRPKGPRFSLSILGEGADFPLRRDPAAHGQCLFVLSGRLLIRLLPPAVCADEVSALQGVLGCATSLTDLFNPEDSLRFVGVALEAELREGSALFVPPGWWHQAICLEGPSVMTWTAYLTEAAGLEAAASSVHPGLGSWHPGLGSWPFFGTDDTREIIGSFEECMHTALDAYPAFCYSGVALPPEAPRWTPQQLVHFVASGGFIRARPEEVGKAVESFEHPASEIELGQAPLHLREWLRTPLPDDISICKPSFDAVPKVVWMYWAQGASRLSGFRLLCVHSWRVQNPSWQVVVLDKESVWQYVDRASGELPWNFEQLETAQQSDALRLALLARYGGVYTDVATICLQPLEKWVWPQVSQGSLEEGLAAWYLACFGLEPGRSREYVENWFFAARRSHPLVVAWRDLYVAGWRDARTRHDYPLGPLFQDVDLSHITITEHRDWLLMHVCFKKLIDEDPEMRRIWSEKMTLLRADDGALAWMADVDAGRPEDAVRRWVFSFDSTWARRQIDLAPMIKFVGDAAQVLQWQDEESLVGRESCLSQVLAHALPVAPPLGCS
eukprot:TRINITY_DN17335_c0_g1_i1.p1 TRINITY_DN17335_c0_g1~~TRINITY_DN17335_c0_g1_i1.p1  ORF type:complete len:955 (-),score=169.03 TRINITY_DN17335_c0_g1_i1:77-2851(-)